MSELILDDSEQTFSLDKPSLVFHINPINKKKSIQSQEINNQILSECNLNIKNLLSNPIAIRIRTTQRSFYKVNPRNTIIQPNSTQQINFVLYVNIPFSELDISQHKFNIEGFEIENYYNNLEPKQAFEEVIKNKIKVKGNCIKMNVEIIEDSNCDNNTDSQSKKVIKINPSKFEEIDKNEQLANLKSDYQNLLSQYNSLEEKYNNLKNAIEKEKNNDFINQDKKLVFDLPVIEEPKISPILTYIFVFLAIVIGYNLTK
jgi:hypothetical protein